jgi:ribosome-binding protein aMBF1 (putative translation factor)
MLVGASSKKMGPVDKPRDTSKRFHAPALALVRRTSWWGVARRSWCDGNSVWNSGSMWGVCDRQDSHDSNYQNDCSGHARCHNQSSLSQFKVSSISCGGKTCFRIGKGDRNMDRNVSLAHTLTAQRTLHGWSLARLARVGGISESELSRIERGQRVPGPAVWWRLAQAARLVPHAA